MVFSSITFLFFFLPVSLIINFLCRKNSIRNTSLLILGLIFYAWGEPVYVFLMIFSIVVNYFFGIAIARTQTRLRKIFLGTDLIFNFSFLFYFKYIGLALKFLSPFISIKIQSVSLPIGISFYTFQIVSYIVDVYRNPELKQKNLLNLGLYISFFPQLIAGPIVRYHDINLQIENRKISLESFTSGAERFIIGLGKKVLLANVFALYADTVLNASLSDYTTRFAWLGMAAYTLQIFFDFSGYSDMAIGLGKMFGFDFPENFNYPYMAKSITDFWRRWHISLSSWFREYLYIPLGGNRKGNLRTYINIFIVFATTGLWHGASINFILWGIGHGILRMFERFLSQTKIAGVFKTSRNIPLIFLKEIFTRIYTLSAVFFLWIFFRNGTKDGFHLFKKMFDFSNSNIETSLKISLLYNAKSVFVFIIGIIFCFPISSYFSKLRETKIKNNFASATFAAVKYIFLILVLAFSISCLISSSYNPFIYFRF